MNSISLATQAAILERGLAAFKKIVSKEVSVNREEMFDLVNFEVFLNELIAKWKEVEGKTHDEILKIAREEMEREERERGK